jgi:hypothetical protein
MLLMSDDGTNAPQFWVGVINGLMSEGIFIEMTLPKWRLNRLRKMADWTM